MILLQARQNLMKSRESLYSTMLREPVPERKNSSEENSACRQCDTCCDSFCCSFWSCVLVIVFLAAGFAGGVVAGAVWQRNGFLYEMGQRFPAINHITDYYSNQFSRQTNTYNPNYHNYNNYYSGQLPPQPPPYPSDQMNQINQNRNNPVNNVGRTRVILPGEEGGQPKVLLPGDERRPVVGQDGFDPRCLWRWSNMSNPYVQGSCSLCAAAK